MRYNRPDIYDESLTYTAPLLDSVTADGSDDGGGDGQIDPRAG